MRRGQRRAGGDPRCVRRQAPPSIWKPAYVAGLLGDGAVRIGELTGIGAHRSAAAPCATECRALGVLGVVTCPVEIGAKTVVLLTVFSGGDNHRFAADGCGRRACLCSGTSRPWCRRVPRTDGVKRMFNLIVYRYTTSTLSNGSTTPPRRTTHVQPTSARQH